MVTGNYLGRPKNRKVNGLRDSAPPSEVRVYDAGTMKLKRIETAAGEVKREYKK